MLALIAAISLTLQAVAQSNDICLPTPLELRQLHDDGHYRSCLREIGRVLQADKTGQSHDVYDLQLLRGDCLLHLEDPASAQLAYSAAAASPLPKQAHQGRAMVFLLRRSTGMTYWPADDHDRRDGINVASDPDRIKALSMLLKDELRGNQALFRQAAKADNLVPIQDALPALMNLYAVERTATREDAHIRPILETIGQRARMLIARELEIRDGTVASLDRRANALVGGWWQSGYGRRGLTTYDRRELRDLISYLQRVEATTRLGRDLAADFDGDAKTWEPLITRAAIVVRRAQDVLDDE